MNDNLVTYIMIDVSDTIDMM